MSKEMLPPDEMAKNIFDSMKGFRVTHKHVKKCAIVAANLLLMNATNETVGYWSKVHVNLLNFPINESKKKNPKR